MLYDLEVPQVLNLRENNTHAFITEVIKEGRHPIDMLTQELLPTFLCLSFKEKEQYEFIY